MRAPLGLAIALILSTAGIHAEPITREILPGGTTVVIQARPSGTFAMDLLARGGSLHDPAEQHGLTAVLSRLLMRGSEDHPGPSLAREVEQTGSSIRPVAGVLAVGLHASGPADAFVRVLDLVSEAALSPRLLAEDLRKEIALERRSLLSSLDQPGTAVRRAALPALFGDHPLGRIADPETYLASIDPWRVREAHAKRFTARRLVVVIVGQIDPTMALRRAREIFADLPSGTLPLPPDPPRPLEEAARIRLSGRTSQPEILLAIPTTGIEPSEEPSMQLLSQILGGTQERLFTEIREKRGWAYWLRMLDWQYPGAGLLGVATAVAGKHLGETERILLEELKTISEVPPALDEMQRARRVLLTDRARSWQRSAYRARLFAARELRGRALSGYDEFAKQLGTVTPESVRTLARRLTRSSAPVVVTLK